MDKTVWKYVLNKQFGPTYFNVPSGSDPLMVAMQGDYICVWFCVNPESPKESRLFYFTGTGHPVPMKDAYIGSVIDGGFVWHVWERRGEHGKADQ